MPNNLYNVREHLGNYFQCMNFSGDTTTDPSQCTQAFWGDRKVGGGGLTNTQEGDRIRPTPPKLLHSHLNF